MDHDPCSWNYFYAMFMLCITILLLFKFSSYPLNKLRLRRAFAATNWFYKRFVFLIYLHLLSTRILFSYEKHAKFNLTLATQFCWSIFPGDTGRDEINRNCGASRTSAWQVNTIFSRLVYGLSIIHTEHKHAQGTYAIRNLCQRVNMKLLLGV